MQRVSIVIYRDRVFLPRQGRHLDGFWVDMEPVITSTLDITNLSRAINDTLQMGHPPTKRGDVSRKDDPVVKATGAKDWYELTSIAESYGIKWKEDSIWVYMYYRDELGRWLGDEERSRKLAPDTPLEEIIGLILEDYSQRRSVP